MSKGLAMKYFVLGPTKNDQYGKASRRAMAVYADTIRSENHALAADIDLWLEQVRAEIFPMVGGNALPTIVGPTMADLERR